MDAEDEKADAEDGRRRTITIDMDEGSPQERTKQGANPIRFALVALPEVAASA